MAEIVQQMPSREEIDRACADAMRVYKRYERKRIVIVCGSLAVIGAVIIALDILHS